MPTVRPLRPLGHGDPARPVPGAGRTADRCAGVLARRHGLVGADPVRGQRAGAARPRDVRPRPAAHRGHGARAVLERADARSAAAERGALPVHDRAARPGPDRGRGPCPPPGARAARPAGRGRPVRRGGRDRGAAGRGGRGRPAGCRAPAVRGVRRGVGRDHAEHGRRPQPGTRGAGPDRPPAAERPGRLLVRGLGPARPAGPGAAGHGRRRRRAHPAVCEEHGAGDVPGRLQHDGGRRRQRRPHPPRPPGNAGPDAGPGAAGHGGG